MADPAHRIEQRRNAEDEDWSLAVHTPSERDIFDARQTNKDLGWEKYRIVGADQVRAIDDHVARLARIVSEIELGMRCKVRIGQDPGTRRAFLQIQCWRMDVITKVEGYGYGGKAYPSEHATDSEIIQMIFGLYKGYWEHEARETFEWRGRRPFGPHISTEALWEVARRVDVRSAKHVEDRPEAGR